MLDLQRGIRFLNKLFNVRTKEWPRVLLLFLIAALSNAGFTWGTTIAYAAFLQEQGAGLETLPWILVFLSILSIIAIAVYTPFVDRIPDGKLHIIIFAIECAGIVFGLILLLFNYASIGYSFLYLWGFALIAVINPHQTTYFNNFYNTQTAKRVLPVINAGYRVGGIVAGLTISLFTSWFASTSTIIVIWLITHAFMMVVIWLLPYLLHDNQADQSSSSSQDASTPTKQGIPFFDNMRDGFQYTIQSTYLRWMAISILIMMTTMALLEYRSTELFLQKYTTAAELADFLGRLVAISNLFVVPILLFGISRIIARLGLGNANLIFPVGNLFISTWLIFSANWISAAAAYLVRNDFRLAFRSPIEGLLYNAVSLRVKGRTRAFVSGLIAPVGTLIGGLLLLLFVVFIPSLAWVIIALIGILSVVYLGSTLVIRKLYSQALIKMLEQEDYSFLLSQEGSDLAAVDPATLKLLEEKLNDSDDPQFTVFMANLISQLGGNDAKKILVAAVKSNSDPDTRAGIIDVMVAAEMWGQTVRELYTDLLADPSGQVRQSVLAGLEQLMGVDDEQFQELALNILDDPDIEVQSQVISALAHTNNFYALTPAVNALKKILYEEDPQKRSRGVLIQGRIAYVYTSRSLSGVTRPVYNLTTYLFDSADQVRLQAALAIEKVSKNKVTDKLAELIIQQMSSVTKDPVERIRQATLVVYSRLGKREAHPILVDALSDGSTGVRSAAVEMMIQIGKSVVPTIHPMLDSSDPSLRKTIAIILCRIDKDEYGSLISSHITNNLLSIYQNNGYLVALAPYLDYTSIAVLQDTIKERNQHLLDEIFYLLSALHDPASIKILTESFRSNSSLVRANTLEALETLTTPQTARLVGPLYDPNINLSYLLRLSEETWEMSHPNSAKIIEILTESSDDWLRAIMIFALGEMAGTMIQTDLLNSQQTQAKKSQEQQPSQSTDSFGALTDTDNNIKVRRSRKRPKPANLFSIFDDNTDAEPKKPETPSRRRITNPLAAMVNGAEEGDDKPGASSLKTPKVNVAKPVLSLEIRTKIPSIIDAAIADPDLEVRTAAQSAKRMLTGLHIVEVRLATHTASRILTDLQNEDTAGEEEFMLSTIEKIIFLKKIPFFQGMTIDQLKTLANVCEEQLFEEDTRIFNERESGGTLYVVISGKVAIEKEGKRKGSFARLDTKDAHSYFGEMNLFDNSPYTSSAIAVQDTLTLRLRREPLIALARQYPDLSLELINVLSQRLREVNEHVVELTRTKPRELHKLFDQFD